MASKYRSRTRDIYKRPALIEKAFAEIWHADARVAAIVASGLVEDQLGLAIEHNFVKLSDGDVGNLFHGVGPLGSFYGKNILAYAMGIIGEKTRKDIETIGQIRNEFAHNPEKIDFDDDHIANLCKSLTFPGRSKAASEEIAKKLMAEGAAVGNPIDPWSGDNRSIFLLTCGRYCEGLFISLASPPLTRSQKAQGTLRD